MRFTITESRMLNADVCLLKLCGDTRAIKRPGQFVQISVPGFYLRRPISVCNWSTGESGSLTLVMKLVGRGTEALAAMREGAELDLLVGLGNGFDTDAFGAESSERPLVVGGGVGTPPLYALTKQLIAQGKAPRVVLGFGTAADVLLRGEFEALGASVEIATLDGSAGVRGLVTDAIAPVCGQFDYIYACGPEPMLRAVHVLGGQLNVSGQYSFEERMGCGFGACMGCSRKTKNGFKRICKDGPVLTSEEIVW